MQKSHIGIYGLGVMGRNLALNFEEKGFMVSVMNRSDAGEENVTADFLNREGAGKSFTGTSSVKEFIGTLASPRAILIMVKAGAPVDAVIQELFPFLDKDDILIDGGNSHFADTGRRQVELEERGIQYLGIGVSGGEEGARNGPSMMPGGPIDAWEQVRPMLEAIAAKTPDGTPCCGRVGDGGSGHFVKMVHNGIEYADMQIIAEVWHIMRSGLQMDPNEISGAFKSWNDGPTGSYLMEITSGILKVNDDDGIPLIDKILDSAGQKGTGRWTITSALELGIPVPVLAEAVFARSTSSLKDLRVAISRQFPVKEPDRRKHINNNEGTGSNTGSETGFKTQSVENKARVYRQGNEKLQQTGENVGQSSRPDPGILQEPNSGENPFRNTFNTGDRNIIVNELEQAVLASRMMALAGGLQMIGSASDQYNWNIEPGTILHNWKAGCIIRSELLHHIAAELSSNDTNDMPEHLLFSNYYREMIPKLHSGWLTTINRALQAGLPVPCMSSAINQFHALRSASLPASLIQAQRDYFGAHTYERTDRPRGEFFHTDWGKSR